MIAYVTLGTSDMDRATNFYNALLAELDPDIKVLMDAGRIKLWGKPGSPNLALATPFDGMPPALAMASWSPWPPPVPSRLTRFTKRRWNWAAPTREPRAGVAEIRGRISAISAIWTAIN